MQKVLLALLVVVTTVTVAFDTCDDKPFCKEIRNKVVDHAVYRFLEDSVEHSGGVLNADLLDESANKILKFTLSALEDGTTRIQIDDPEKPRHSVPEALKGELATNDDIDVDITRGKVTVQNGAVEIGIFTFPFVIMVVTENSEIVLNANQRLEFKSGDDEAIAIDVKFPGTSTAYGIPEHGEKLALKDTKVGGRDPYRLFNMDYCCYALETPDPLYGTVPVLYAHGTERSAGVFWLTSSQTFVDVNTENDEVNGLFISQTGMIDVFVLPGPTLPAAVQQYTHITGSAPLPPQFVFGYHQSRWSYLTQDDAENVIDQLDANDYPLDVLWLDVDYTDAKKYFTWNYTAFPNPLGLQGKLADNGRKMVTIIDPHIKVETGYRIYDEGLAGKYFVKNSDGSTFEGSCWPGLSSYIDFTNPDALDWYSQQFSFDNFPDTSDIVNIWNDMNEPSVFDVFEKTIPDDAVHHNGWTHADVHNMYGFLQTKGTYNGLVARSNGQQRPFILTRSHFAGSQRYTAVWTGDNVASWDHLKISVPMCLTEGLAGITYCGADVGGFVDNPDDELLQRWFQLGAWLPFFREHNAEGTIRREPYLYPDNVQNVIRTAIRNRYKYLPYFYTLAFEHELTGTPVVVPTTFHYPKEQQLLREDSQFMVGSNILVAAVTDPGVTNINVYLPGSSFTIWYNIQDNKIYRGSGSYNIPVTIESVPVYHRGGSIIARKDTARKSSAQMQNDPYTLYVFTDSFGQAEGNLYIDDTLSYNYRNNQYNYVRYVYDNGVLSSSKIHPDAEYGGAIAIDRIVVYQIATADDTKEHHRALRNSEAPEISNPQMKISNVNLPVNKEFKIELY